MEYSIPFNYISSLGGFGSVQETDATVTSRYLENGIKVERA